MSTLPRESQDNKILPKNDKFNIWVKFGNKIQAIMKRDKHIANIFYKPAENGNVCEF